MTGSQNIVKKQIERALGKTNKGYTILTEVFEFRKGLTIRILGRPRIYLEQESIMVATVSGVTSAELVIVTILTA